MDVQSSNIEQKLSALNERLKSYEQVIIAFSGAWIARFWPRPHGEHWGKMY